MIDENGMVYCICGSTDVFLDDGIYYCYTCGMSWTIEDEINENR